MHIKTGSTFKWFMQMVHSTVMSINKYHKIYNSIVNVNVNLYSASSQEAPLMRSMCRVLIKKTRLQCTTKTVNLHVQLTQVVSEQVPRRWSSDSEGATAVRIELKPWNNE